MMRWNKPLATVLCLALFVGFAWAAEESLYFDNEELRERYQTLTFQLRCPKCQNQNIAGSNAPIAEDMRDKTYELLHLGYSNDEIVDYMVDRYTEFVIYKPRVTLGTVWLWLAPVLGIVIGAALILWLSRRSRQTSQAPLSDEERARIQAILDKDSESS
ncbi:cytochrome c-type biogenesis protein [Saccharospirillum salsuginis]|uniref:Cytochrome c-type biogenesis protein n=1 Tax=Saccharospirillum salsuginis TaxID=418750 RepID=A0A918KTS6_9GAMM|nr:cytochrome c-type biogenesis protein [Saccharospirillum salsuginis]GGX75673.1 cytochrome c-type biogenesis protein CcmH [Saccharospirillum salsuginis]